MGELAVLFSFLVGTTINVVFELMTVDQGIASFIGLSVGYLYRMWEDSSKQC